MSQKVFSNVVFDDWEIVVIFVCAGGLAGLCGLAAGGRVQYLVPLALSIALSPLIPSIQVSCYHQTSIVRQIFFNVADSGCLSRILIFFSSRIQHLHKQWRKKK
jgi:hypothetical protein